MQSGFNGGLPYLQALQSPPPAILPTVSTTTVTVAGVTARVITNLSWNPVAAIQTSNAPAFVEERAAIIAGASATGTATASTYLDAILSGTGVGLGPGVTPQAEGAWAALYERLGILPTWTGSNTTTLAAGVAALQKAHARPLAIENYLVQIGGYSWAGAAAQAAAGFPSPNRGVGTGGRLAGVADGAGPPRGGRESIPQQVSAAGL